MDQSSRILSDIITYTKYAKYIPEVKRREVWEEMVDRNMQMHIRKFPNLKDEIRQNYINVYKKNALPAMRSMQFGGKPIEISPVRIYNCSYAPIDHPMAFCEAMFLLLSGVGFGYSVQKHHIEKLPVIKGVLNPKGRERKKRYLIGDSIEGWADAIKALINSYFYNEKEIEFDYQDIRHKGARLVTSGGKAPGPQPLKDCIHNIRKVLDNALTERGLGCRLQSIEAHDILCHIADAVLSGGIRRAAMISFFSLDDEVMMNCKTMNELELNPQRHRANNSIVILRHRIKEEVFMELWDKIKEIGTGEPGIFFSNDKEQLANPCQPKWAKLLTPKGIRELKDINVGDSIWSKEGWTKVIKKWSTGIKPVFKYETTAGIFYGTENHKIVSNGEKIEVKDADSIDIIKADTYGTGYDAQDVMDGLVIGDGTIHKASGDLILLCVGQNDKDYFESDIKDLFKRYRPGVSEYTYEIETTITKDELLRTYDRRVPERYITDPKKAIGFLRGLYSANGSVCGDRITLKSSSKGLIEDVQLMLNSLGIFSYYTTNKSSTVTFNNGEYVCKESYDLNISTDREEFLNKIGFIQNYKKEKIEVKGIRQFKKTFDIKNISLVSEEEVFDITVDNKSHTYWTQGCDVSNCVEISLKPFTFCNLVTINANEIHTQEEFNAYSKSATFVATLQSSYTNFHYLREIWQDATEKESLIGVSLTGVASGTLDKLSLTEAADVVKKENLRVSKLIGINKAARCTCIKPEGTASIVLGTSSGIHPWHDKYYVRRIRLGKDESIYKYLVKQIPDLLENEYFKPDTQAVLSIPIKAPEGCITREESPIHLLERVKKYNTEWVRGGHRSGNNTNNVSVTVSIKESEWGIVGKWMWENRAFYNGIAVAPYDNESYKQMPFETITKEQYEKMIEKVKDIDLTQIMEEEDNTTVQNEVACAGGSCAII